jgi:hypothetical protein
MAGKVLEAFSISRGTPMRLSIFTVAVVLLATPALAAVECPAGTFNMDECLKLKHEVEEFDARVKANEDRFAAQERQFDAERRASDARRRALDELAGRPRMRCYPDGNGPETCYLER